MVQDKEIELIEETTKNQRVGTLETYVVISVAASSAFTAVTTFFTSIIISKYSSYNPSINIPTLFLIISTFGFLYATLIFGNNVSNILDLNLSKFKQSRALGNALCEYLGVYFLMLAIPLIINVVSTDLFLRISTSTLDMTGLLIYHISGFSIMEKNYKHYHLTFLSIIFILEILLIVFQFQNTFIFEIITAVLTFFIFSLSFFSRKRMI